MLQQTKLRRLFLPLVGINKTIFRDNILTMIVIGFKYKDRYRRYRLFIRVSDLALATKMETKNKAKAIYKEENYYILEFECLPKKKEIWNILIQGNYKRLPLSSLSDFYKMISSEEYKFLQETISDSDDAYITKLATKISGRDEKHRLERAKDLFDSEPTAIRSRLELLEKIKLNTI